MTGVQTCALPICEDGAPTYHRTHSCYSVAAFHEALRILLGYGRAQKAVDYAYHEKALRQAVEAMGCEVTSNMTSLVVLNLPGKLAGSEKDLVAACREQNFGIWPTLSSPVQVRIGILNQLNQDAITDRSEERRVGKECRSRWSAYP